MMQPNSNETQQKVNLVEEKLKAIEGNSSIKGMDTIELSLVPNVVIPYKFKMPDFVKYNRASCPKAHMIMFSQKMVSHMGNDKCLSIAFKRA